MAVDSHGNFMVIWDSDPGQDGVDDGGQLDKDPKTPGTDYGFRLWDVAARRQPPLPPKAAEDASGPP